MANVPFYTYDSFLAELAKGKDSVLALYTDTLSLYFSNTTPNRATHSTKADAPDITAKNGYAGMIDLTITSRSIVDNEYRIIAADPPTWEATTATDGTGFGPFRYVELVSKTSSNTDSSRRLIGYWAYPSAITVTAGNYFKFDANATTGVFRLRNS